MTGPGVGHRITRHISPDPLAEMGSRSHVLVSRTLENMLAHFGELADRGKEIIWPSLVISTWLAPLGSTPMVFVQVDVDVVPLADAPLAYVRANGPSWLHRVEAAEATAESASERAATAERVAAAATRINHRVAARLRALVADGSLDRAEGARLVSVLNGEPEPNTQEEARDPWVADRETGA